MNSILYIDDENLNTFMFKKLFEKKYNVITSNSGQNGLDFLKQNSDIQLVITDFRMPGMNGLEFILQASQMYSNLYFFILSGYQINAEIEEALKNNVVHEFIQKPYDSKNLNEIIQKYLP